MRILLKKTRSTFEIEIHWGWLPILKYEIRADQARDKYKKVIASPSRESYFLIDRIEKGRKCPKSKD